jgi:hypothetical protein
VPPSRANPVLESRPSASPSLATPASRKLVKTEHAGIYQRGNCYVVVYRDYAGRQHKKAAGRNVRQAKATQARYSRTFDGARTASPPGRRSRPTLGSGWRPTKAGYGAASRRTRWVDYRRYLEHYAIPYFGKRRLAQIAGPTSRHSRGTSGRRDRRTRSSQGQHREGDHGAPQSALCYRLRGWSDSLESGGRRSHHRQGSTRREGAKALDADQAPLAGRRSRYRQRCDRAAVPRRRHRLPGRATAFAGFGQRPTSRKRFGHSGRTTGHPTMASSSRPSREGESTPRTS